MYGKSYHLILLVEELTSVFIYYLVNKKVRTNIRYKTFISNLSLFRNEIIRFNNIRIRIPDFIYNMI